jgi:four helix bundle protein
MNNISEGFCRNSDAEFRQFLNISKGSESHLVHDFIKQFV